MAAISFAPADSWIAARWFHNRLLRDVAVSCGNDERITAAIETAIALDGLHLHLLDQGLAEKILEGLLKVIDLVLQEEDSQLMWKNGLNAEDQDLYKRSLPDLQAYLKLHLPFRIVCALY